ncbi:MAG: restriction endonuclease subunit S [Candidatus Schmidhempelia sp.]|nr:restriction endonuclease subunit S [Candidatus Schmidhempelia sp.]
MIRRDNIIELLKGVKVEWRALGTIAQYIRGVTYNKTNESDNEIGYKVLRANNITLSNNTLNFNDIKIINFDTKVKDTQKLYKNDILISAASGSREHVGKVAFIANNIDYYFGGFMGVIRSSNKIHPRYLFHILTSKIFQNYLNEMLNSSTINNLNSKVMEEFQIPIPPISVQSKIVSFLDKFTTLTAELTAELTIRKKQYNYYRDKLLSFKEDEVNWKTLGEILHRTKGTKITASKMKEMHKDNAPLKIFAGGKTFALVNFDDIPQKDINREPSIVVKSRGIIEFEYYDKPFSHKNEMWSYHSKHDSLNIKYIYYFLKNKELYFQNIGRKMQMPQIAIPDTDKFLIPIPSLNTQNRIVGILDKFDTLTTSITEGLPHEIELRKKQYEYYRNLLLNFPKAQEK